MKIIIVCVLLSALMALYACRSTPPIQRAENVDLNAFMGDWYVLAHIPTFIEDEAYNAVESYQRESTNKIATTFRFNQAGFKGEEKVYHPTGFVQTESNAYWKMQFMWPFKSEFIISYVDADYQHTIIARSKRDYVWIMARKPVIDDDMLNLLIDEVESLGYNRDDVRFVPQQAR
ncbi:MAG: lipocalin family protein [Proteobacteria bacterium]|nr:lipocalin family protein [Pseudomonadota bacterium]